jgi:hypothetical protein
MSSIPVPVKPFPTYKWRWFSYEPTEGLLEPPVFLGVLRALAENEGKAPSDDTVIKRLSVVQKETGTDVNLAREDDRNLIRNAGQYWKGMGVLLPTRGEIRLSQLGKLVSTGKVTQNEFASIVVQQTVLPNPWTFSGQEFNSWKNADLEIRPLALILQVLDTLAHNQGGLSIAYITPDELIRILIPLAGAKASVDTIAQAIVKHRNGRLNVDNWPNCVPGSNDHRFAKEFLRFLANYGICRQQKMKKAKDNRYWLDELYDEKTLTPKTKGSLFSEGADTNSILQSVRDSSLPSMIERSRVLLNVIARPGQSKFRDDILTAYSGRCFLTGESMGEVLEAAHIYPVKFGGADLRENGLCLRVDLHRLYDSNNLRIEPNGFIGLSEALAASKNYAFLPKKVQLPQFVKAANLEWRCKYSFF